MALLAGTIRPEHPVSKPLLYGGGKEEPRGVRTTTDIPAGVTCGYVEGEHFLSDKIKDNMTAKQFVQVSNIFFFFITSLIFDFALD